MSAAESMSERMRVSVGGRVGMSERVWGAQIGLGWDGRGESGLT